MLNLFDHIFKQCSVFLVITGNETIKQDENNKISQNNIIRNCKLKLSQGSGQTGLLAEIKILLLLDDHNFLKN